MSNSSPGKTFEGLVRGDLATFLKERSARQLKLLRKPWIDGKNECPIACTFAKFMFEGKTHAALHLLANGAKGSLLQRDQTVDVDEFNSKSVTAVLQGIRPPGLLASTNSIEFTQESPTPETHLVIFDGIDARLTRFMALTTREMQVLQAWIPKHGGNCVLPSNLLIVPFVSHLLISK